MPSGRVLIYIATVALAAVLLLVGLRPGTIPGGPLIFMLICLAALSTLADLRPVSLPHGATVSVSTAINFATAILFGPGWAAIVATVAAAVSDACLRKPWYKVLFNASVAAIAVGLSAVLFHNVHEVAAGPLHSLRNVMAMVVYGLACFTLSSVFIASVIGLNQGVSAGQVWLMNFRGVALQFASMIPIGALIATTFLDAAYLGATMLIVLLILVYYALQTSQQLRKEARLTIETMVDTIACRDLYTGSHSQSVTRLATLIAEQMRLPLNEVHTITLAARIHDLGKVAIPDAVLLKPGPLTPEEMEIMKTHAEVGASIVARLSVYDRARSYMLHHHEHFNGKGYPNGLAGEEIPLGARVIAVADAYDAMTSDRPYRPGLSHAVAMERLLNGRGTQWDPRCVDALAAALGTPVPAPALAPEPE